MSKEIRTIECNTIQETEAIYMQMREEKCWVVEKPLKVYWSWKKFKTVVGFSMKKVDKRPMDIFEFGQKLSEALPQLSKSLSIISEYKMKKKLQKIINQ